MKFPPKRAGGKRPAGAAALALSLLLAAEMVLAAGLAAQTTATFEDLNNPQVRSISSKLMCQCGGCGASVLNCPHELDCASRGYVLKTIRTGLASGKSEQAIISGMVAQYGPKILVEPPRAGFSWLGWIMPYAALLIGGAAVAFVLWRWRAEPLAEEPASVEAVDGTAGLGVSPSVPGNELVEKYRAQIDRELEREA